MNADAIGAFYYDKRLKNGTEARCKVEVFPLEVNSQRKGKRKTRWFELRKAAKVVQKPGLRRLLRNLDALVPTGTRR